MLALLCDGLERTSRAPRGEYRGNGLSVDIDARRGIQGRQLPQN